MHSRLCLCLHEKNPDILFRWGTLATMQKYRHSHIEIKLIDDVKMVRVPGPKEIASSRRLEYVCNSRA